MKKSDIIKEWVSLGPGKPTFSAFEYQMTKPIQPNRYGVIDIFGLFDLMCKNDNYLLYLKLAQKLSSSTVAKAKAAVRRPKYYAAENERRRSLARNRRKIRNRYTTNICPTREMILEAWDKRRMSHESAIRFGSLLEDLECYLDNSLRRDENGIIIGRNPGIKGWLGENIPEIYAKYATVMRYKAAAKKLKQIVELTDPTPVEVVLPNNEDNKEIDVKRDYGADERVNEGLVDEQGRDDGERKDESDGSVRENGMRNEKHENNNENKATVIGVNVAGVMVNAAIGRARAIWMEIVTNIGPKVTSLIRRIDELTDPSRIEDQNMLSIWKEKYRNEIMVRTKSTA